MGDNPNILGSFRLFVGQDQLGENYLTYSHTWGSKNTLGKKNALHIRDIQTPPNKSCMRQFSPRMVRERKMRTNFFSTNFLNTPSGPGHPGRTPGTSQIPLFETQGRQTSEGEHELFGHQPFAWKTPTPPGGLRTQKLIFVLFFLA